MEITHRRLHRVDVLSLSGRLQAGDDATLQDRINQLFAEGRYHLVLDLAELEFISSPGIRVLIEARKRARERHRGDIHLVNVPPRVKSVFDTTGVTQLFQIHDDLLEAVDSV